MNTIRTAAIIGAGIAGLACATTLQTANISVTLFDKGRRPGGRVATRRADGLTFDHGAQYATARGAAFSAVMAQMHAAGVAAPWPASQSDPHWVGIPGMSALPRFMADALEARGAQFAMERHVAFLHAEPDGWHVRHHPAASLRPGTVTSEGGEMAGPFDVVLLALPSVQAAPLLDAIAHPAAASLASIVFAPCWAAMAAFGEMVAGPDTQRHRGGTLAWIARDSARPGRPALPDAWMLHASPAWSRANLERPASDVAADLLAAFAGLAGPLPAPIHLSAHRWRYALVEHALGQPCLWDAARRIGLCGDWCLGPRVEQAFDSGVALASAVLDRT